MQRRVWQHLHQEGAFESAARQQSFSACQMRPVEHQAVNADDAGVRTGGERPNDGARLPQRLRCRREDGIDDPGTARG